MSLKAIIDQILKEKQRSLSWLADSMGKTFDGLRLGLINESIKYRDILLMAEILQVSPGHFFEKAEDLNLPQMNLSESVSETSDNLKGCRELIVTLKDQLKDKERIIFLLNNANGISN